MGITSYLNIKDYLFGVVRNGSPFALSGIYNRMLPYAYHREAKATYNVIVIVIVIVSVIVIVPVKGKVNNKKNVYAIGKGKGKVEGNPLGKPTLLQHWNSPFYYERSDVFKKIMYRILKRS